MNSLLIANSVQVDWSFVISVCITIITILSIREVGNDVRAKNNINKVVIDFIGCLIAYAILASVVAGFTCLTNLIIEAVS